ncbi:unnamed protein product [Auanema sp. JU1783]|nr:unnamed protein product [Auanema sp. JU1783]
MKAMKFSAHEDQEDDRFPFELLPHEIKEMILERVIDETSDIDDFKKFWSLKRVNKEFNSILSSNYARRHFLSYPIAIFLLHIHNLESHVFMHITVTDEFINGNLPIQFFNPKSIRLEIEDEMKWEEFPRYLKDKPFRIGFLQIGPDCDVSNAHMIRALRELANQTSEAIEELVDQASEVCRLFLDEQTQRTSLISKIFISTIDNVSW